MRVLHVTNIISHHQLPLARQLAATVGGSSFRFAAVSTPNREILRRRGWNIEETENLEPWILLADEKDADRLEYDKWWDDADVVIAGYRGVPRLADRVRRGKLTFYMSERWWKPPIGMARLLHPRFAWMAYRFFQLSRSPSFHFLPMGGYATSDIRRIAAFPRRTWNWGYVTDVPDPLPTCRERGDAFHILWAGRMLAWKRVDTLVRAFALLLRQNPNSRLTLIGDGCRCESLKQLVKKLGVGGNVDFHSSVPFAQVRQWMRNAHVYVLPSNSYEGWGAVLNEAMSECCCVVASQAGGAAKTMIRHGENGLLFQCGNHGQLSNLLIQLSSDEPLRRKLAEAGQRTVAEEWSPKTAAERFLAVSQSLLAGQQPPTYDAGPMAPV